MVQKKCLVCNKLSHSLMIILLHFAKDCVRDSDLICHNRLRMLTWHLTNDTRYTNYDICYFFVVSAKLSVVFFFVCVGKSMHHSHVSHMARIARIMLHLQLKNGHPKWACLAF